MIDENGDRRGRHEDERRDDGVFRAHPDPANSVAAGATAAEARAESDEQPGHGHDRERAHWPIKRGALPERETERGAANQADEEDQAPRLVMCRRNKEAAEDAWGRMLDWFKRFGVS